MATCYSHTETDRSVFYSHQPDKGNRLKRPLNR